MSSSRFLYADWPAPPGVRALTTTRRGGVSRGAFASFNLAAHVGDDPERVAENRRRLTAALALPAEPLWLSQEHGAAVVSAADAVPGTVADAAFATVPGVVCAVLTADCVPLALCDRAGSRVAAVHVGWRGLAAGIVEQALDALAVPAAEVLAWMGPGISQAAFEVGEDVVAALAGDAGRKGFRRNAAGRWQADLYALIRERLERAGVAQIHGGDRCTVAEPEAFFSYRRDGRCGRMATLVWLDTPAGRTAR